jgi:hypothetical protein
MKKLFKIKNKCGMDLSETEELYHGLGHFAQKKFGFKKPPTLHLVSDGDNASKPLGKTAYYDPQGMAVTIYTDNRHTKDILRSLAHELVHHTQNENGMLNDTGYHGVGYAQKNKDLRQSEKEAYLKGNMCFRDWEDSLKQSKPTIYNEWRNIMSTKNWKNNELMENLTEKFGFKMDLGLLKEGKMPDGLAKYKKEQDEKAGKKSKDGEEESEDSDDNSKEKPDFPDVDGDGDKKEPIKKAQQDKNEMSETQIHEMASEGQNTSQTVMRSYQVFKNEYGEEVDIEIEPMIISLLNHYETNAGSLNESGIPTIKANLTAAELAAFDHALDMVAEEVSSMQFQKLLGFLGQTSTEPIPAPFPGDKSPVFSYRKQSKVTEAFVGALKRISRISKV